MISRCTSITIRVVVWVLLVELASILLSSSLQTSCPPPLRHRTGPFQSVVPTTRRTSTVLRASDRNRREALLDIASSTGSVAAILGTPTVAVSHNDRETIRLDSNTTPTTRSNTVVYLSSPSSNDPGEPLEFPLVSFGLQIYSNDVAYKLTRTAIDLGYRNFFASVLAGNQRGFAKAVKDSGIPRSDLFLCGSVVSNRAQGYEAAYQSTTQGWKKNMEEFAVGDIEYLDQIVLDYPGPDCPSIRGQWKAFQEMYHQKRTRSLAVSNFSPSQLDCILNDAQTTVRPVLNQIPFSVAYHRGDATSIVQEHTQRNILVQAWSPLGGSLGTRFDSKIKATCAQIGQRYGNKSYAQVALRWIVQKGASFTTQSKNIDHFKEDLNIFDFELSDQDMAILDTLA